MDDKKQSNDPKDEIVDVTPIEGDTAEQAEIVELSEDEIPDAVKTQLSIENLIKTFISRIARLKEDIKPANEMVNDYLNNSEEYREATEAAKEASRKKTSVKKNLLIAPEGKTANDKLTQLKADLQEAQKSLSDYLGEYQKLTGSNEIEGEDGELRQIVYIAKLVRKTNLER